MDEKGCERTKNDRIGRVIQWMGRLESISRCKANKYEVVRSVWKMMVPSIMYGLETMSWKKNKFEKLVVIQNKIGRIALGCK